MIDNIPEHHKAIAKHIAYIWKVRPQVKVWSCELGSSAQLSIANLEQFPIPEAVVSRLIICYLFELVSIYISNLLIIKMLRIRYSSRELEIEGSNQDYVLLRSELNKIICNQNISSIELICDTKFDPSPYEKKCKKIQIKRGSGLNKFIVSGSTLKVEGSSVTLKNFSDNFPDGCTNHESIIEYHHHYDVYSFPGYISSDCPEVVLSLRQ